MSFVGIVELSTVQHHAILVIVKKKQEGIMATVILIGGKLRTVVYNFYKSKIIMHT
jgi:hypothetical protein